MVALFVVACGESPTEPASLTIMTAQVNGQQWTATQPHAAYYEAVEGTVTITGSQQDGSGGFRNIYLQFGNVSGPGSYSLDDAASGGNYASFTVADGDGTVVYRTAEPLAGSVEITFLDRDENAMRGTFSFTGRNPESGEVTVTGGLFVGNYEELLISFF